MLCKFCHKETSSKDGYHPRCKLKALAGGAKPARLTKATPGVVARAPKLKKPTAPTKLCKFCHKGTSSKDGYHPRCREKARAGERARLAAEKAEQARLAAKLAAERKAERLGAKKRAERERLAAEQARLIAGKKAQRARVVVKKRSFKTVAARWSAPTLVEHWYIYEGTNHTLREVYIGVSISPVARVNGSHCSGGTVALRHWKCRVHHIIWSQLSRHPDQSTASQLAHDRERTYIHPLGYRIILTAGI